MPFARITILCFGASYAMALVLELVQLYWRRPFLRLLSLSFGAAGLLAHSLFLVFHPPSLASESGSLLLLSWILAVFYLYGSLHHRRLAWGVFVLPIVLGLVASARMEETGSASTWSGVLRSLRGPSFWSATHYTLLLLGAVGVSVGFIASVMYLMQAHRLRTKTAPEQGLKLLSLERLETMNRRAILLAFPLLTAGVLVGAALMLERRVELARDKVDLKILGTVLLWLVFALVLYLRYGFHLRGRRQAILTIVAFFLLVLTLASSHNSVPGGGP